MNLQSKPICKGKLFLQPGGVSFYRVRDGFALHSQNQVQLSATHRILSYVE